MVRVAGPAFFPGLVKNLKVTEPTLNQVNQCFIVVNKPDIEITCQPQP